MVINKNSWHYKFWSKSYSLGETPDSIDLCRYCHRIFWVALGKLFFGVMLAYAICSILFGLYLGGLGAYHHPLVALEIAAAAITLVCGIMFYLVWLHKKPTEQKGLVSHWWTARKEKVCPLLKFEDK